MAEFSITHSLTCVGAGGGDGGGEGGLAGCYVISSYFTKYVDK